MSDRDYNKATVLIVGAGPSGLSCALSLKQLRPELDVCVVDKANGAGNHVLSGAVLEPQAIHRLLDSVSSGWRETSQAKEILSRTVDQDDIQLFTPACSVSLNPSIAVSKLLKLNTAQMSHQGDYIVSASKLTKWLADIARSKGIEVLYGFAADEVLWDSSKMTADGVRLVDQGLGKDGHKQPNYLPGETIKADYIVLAEGCDGYITEKFIKQASLFRRSVQLYSVGIKELIQVSEEQYRTFGDKRVVHVLGYPLWSPIVGPGVFGGGFMYSYGGNQIAVGMIVGADWAYADFNPQDALTLFKEHPFVRKYLKGGTIVEAGAKMIPEGGLFALPRDLKTNAIGSGNVLIVGDGAGFVNMIKIKGLHNAISSGVSAGEAILQSIEKGGQAAVGYSKRLEQIGVIAEMSSAKNFRQTVAKLGNSVGLPLTVLGGLLPHFEVEPDYKAMRQANYRFKPSVPYDKTEFTALANTGHREEQPIHCKIIDSKRCEECSRLFGQPCQIFCPAGVYENIQGVLKPANASNCVHCKTCQRKCPFDNLRWTVPEGTGGPRYSNM